MELWKSSIWQTASHATTLATFGDHAYWCGDGVNLIACFKGSSSSGRHDKSVEMLTMDEYTTLNSRDNE
jgi:hypothetical protein